MVGFESLQCTQDCSSPKGATLSLNPKTVAHSNPRGLSHDPGGDGLIVRVPVGKRMVNNSNVVLETQSQDLGVFWHFKEI